MTDFVIELLQFLSSEFPIPSGPVDLWILRSLSRFLTFVESTLMKLRFCFEHVGISVFRLDARKEEVEALSFSSICG